MSSYSLNLLVHKAADNFGFYFRVFVFNKHEHVKIGLLIMISSYPRTEGMNGDNTLGKSFLEFFYKPF